MAEVCIVGGGPAGMAMARALLRQGVSFEVFERHDDVGGLWDPENPGTPVYQSAHFISSKTQSHYFDFPMPDDYPHYPSNRQILDYQRAFVDAHGLRDHVTFGVEVELAEPIASGWRVHLSTGETREYGHLVAANGTNWHAVMPEFEGQFDGEIAGGLTGRSISGRNPRSVIGTLPGGKIGLLNIDGRSTKSVGATLTETARVAKALGFRDAVNLDGGGSTVLVAGTTLLNTYSGSRMRSVSDAIVLVPRR